MKGPNTYLAPRLTAVLEVLVLGLVVFVLAYVCLEVPRDGRASPIWLSNAAVLAVLLRRPVSRWPEMLAAAVVGNIAADLTHGDTFAVGLTLTAANLLEIILCASILRRVLGAECKLSRGRDLAWFLGVAGVVGPLVSSLAATATLVFMGRHFSPPDIGVWMFADSIGLLMVTPCLLTLQEARQILRDRPMTSAGLLSITLLVAVSVIVFGQARMPLMFLIPPALVFVAFELEVLGGAIGSMIVAGVAIGFEVNGVGPHRLIPGDVVIQAVVVQLFFATNVLIGLTFGSLQAQRRQTRRELERALAGAREQTRRALMAEEVAGVGYWRLDAATYVLEWSPQMCRIFGVPVSPIPDLAMARQFVDPAAEKSRKHRTVRALTKGEGWENVLTRVDRPDGEVRWVLGQGVCEKDEQGRVTAVLGTIVDVTRQKALEEELRAARAVAEDAAAVKSEFLANMSHELRTPLTAIIGYTDLIERQEGLAPKARTYVDRVRSASKSLLVTVNDVLDFSRLEAGQVEIRIAAASPMEVMDDVAAICAGQAAAKGLALRVETKGSLPALVMTDADRLRQVLLNLVGNAVKFTGSGSVRMIARYDPGKARLAFEVIDTGPGLSRRQLAGLFKRFSQVDASSTRRHAGTGLGLAICKGLVEAMGGEIGAKSRPGEGSRFWFYVPAPHAETGATSSLQSATTDALVGWRVLVVDDESVTRDLARAILAPAGAEVREACDGHEAVRIALEVPFDVILMDLHMPGLDGRAAADRIRSAQGPNQSTPIIAFSAAVGGRRAHDFKAMGFDGQVGKPVDALALVDAIIQSAASWPAAASGAARRGVGKPEAKKHLLAHSALRCTGAT